MDGSAVRRPVCSMPDRFSGTMPFSIRRGTLIMETVTQYSGIVLDSTEILLHTHIAN